MLRNKVIELSPIINRYIKSSTHCFLTTILSFARLPAPPVSAEELKRECHPGFAEMTYSSLRSGK